MKRTHTWLFGLLLAISLAAPFTASAAEHAATAEELQEVASTQKSKFVWENTGTSWRLLYLTPSSTEWSYAHKWVQIGADFYYFDDNGDVMEGWFQDASGKWFFAQYDNSDRNSADVGKVVTGWAKIRGSNGVEKYFYFGTDASTGIPSGMYVSDTEGFYKTYTIDGKDYQFDSIGRCAQNQIDTAVSYARNRQENR